MSFRKSPDPQKKASKPDTTLEQNEEKFDMLGLLTEVFENGLCPRIATVSRTSPKNLVYDPKDDQDTTKKLKPLKVR